MFDAIFWGAVMRFVQSLLQASPFILTGFIVAGVFQRLLGYENTRKLFGEGTWRSLPQAWLIGMLLPVCSLGVIPVMRAMKRAGISVGTILAFGLTAPLFNPLSVLYGLTLSEPFTIFAFALCSLFVVTCIGLAFDRLFPHIARAETEPVMTSFGIKRIMAIMVTIGRDIWSRSSIYIFIGLTGVILLSVVLPKGAFQSQVNGGNLWAPLLMTGVAVPAYATPMLAMSQLGMMFQHGNSVGAAFALLILGAGLNFGIIAWMYFNYGWQKSTAWMGILLAVVIGLGYALEKPLYPTDIEAANHTHAFDIYCCPFHLSDPQVLQTMTQKLKDRLLDHPEERIAFYFLLFLVAAGFVITMIDRTYDLEGWLTRKARGDTNLSGHWDIILPNWVLGGAALLILIAVSLAGCFAYYPPPAEAIDEIYIVKGEVLGAALSGNQKHAMYWLPVWEDWNRRLQVGVYLRYGQLSEYHRMKARVVRDLLELLEHAMEDDKKEETRQLVNALSRAQMRLVTAYTTEL